MRYAKYGADHELGQTQSFGWTIVLETPGLALFRLKHKPRFAKMVIRDIYQCVGSRASDGFRGEVCPDLPCILGLFLQQVTDFDQIAHV